MAPLKNRLEGWELPTQSKACVPLSFQPGLDWGGNGGHDTSLNNTQRWGKPCLGPPNTTAAHVHRDLPLPLCHPADCRRSAPWGLGAAWGAAACSAFSLSAPWSAPPWLDAGFAFSFLFQRPQGSEKAEVPFSLVCLLLATLCQIVVPVSVETLGTTGQRPCALQASTSRCWGQVLGLGSAGGAVP